MNVNTAIFLPFFIALPLLTGCDDETVSPVEDIKRVVDHVYPSPSGIYRVGTQEFDLIDYREDTLNPISGEMRKLHIKVYYPSDTESEQYENTLMMVDTKSSTYLVFALPMHPFIHNNMI